MQISVECRGVAQLGSALVSGTRGREFESRRPDQMKAEAGACAPAFFVLAPAFLIAKKCLIRYNNVRLFACYFLRRLKYLREVVECLF